MKANARFITQPYKHVYELLTYGGSILATFAKLKNKNEREQCCASLSVARDYFQFSRNNVWEQDLCISVITKQRTFLSGCAVCQESGEVKLPFIVYRSLIFNFVDRCKHCKGGEKVGRTSFKSGRMFSLRHGEFAC